MIGRKEGVLVCLTLFIDEKSMACTCGARIEAGILAVLLASTTLTKVLPTKPFFFRTNSARIDQLILSATTEFICAENN